MRAAIYGAGAMGTVLGAFITAGGGKIDLITRNLRHVEALNKNGAHVVGGADIKVNVSALTPDKMTGEYDIIFLMTKQQENAQTLEFLKPFLKSDGVICTMQNGLPEESVANAVGYERCLGCAVSWGAVLKDSGVACLTSDKDKMTFALGSPFGSNRKLEEVKELLSLAGKVEIEQNFLGARWAKLCINGAFSPLSAMTGMTFGEIAKDSLSRRIALKILREGFEAAKAQGVKLAGIQGHDITRIFKFKPFALSVMPLAMRSHSEIISGMYFDLKSGRQCEIDYINGEIVRAAKSGGVDVPVCERVIKLIKEIERGEREISYENLKCI